LPVGTIVYWDDAANVATNVAAGNKQLGKVVRAAAAADATVRVRLSQ
jgi:predicted RecA/RadA family phage recombinase